MKIKTILIGMILLNSIMANAKVDSISVSVKRLINNATMVQYNEMQDETISAQTIQKQLVDDIINDGIEAALLKPTEQLLESEFYENSEMLKKDIENVRNKLEQNPQLQVAWSEEVKCIAKCSAGTFIEGAVGAGAGALIGGPVGEVIGGAAGITKGAIEHCGDCKPKKEPKEHINKKD